MIPVILESPFAAETEEGVERNLEYLRACMNDCLHRGEAPFASHGLYTQPGVLDDKKPEERELGMRAGFAWKLLAAKTVVYTDLGITRGMQRGIEIANEAGQPVQYRSITWRPSS